MSCELSAWYRKMQSIFFKIKLFKNQFSLVSNSQWIKGPYITDNSLPFKSCCSKLSTFIFNITLQKCLPRCQEKFYIYSWRIMIWHHWKCQAQLCYVHGCPIASCQIPVSHFILLWQFWKPSPPNRVGFGGKSGEISHSYCYCLS